MISVKTSNTVVPDSAASYWVQPIVAATATRIVISGIYPDARYASLSVYTPHGSPFVTDGISSSLPYYRIAPERGSTNPWQAHAAQEAGSKRRFVRTCHRARSMSRPYHRAPPRNIPPTSSIASTSRPAATSRACNSPH